MINLTEVAKENGAVVMPKGTQVQPVTLKHEAVVLTPEELQATVEQVCKPLVEALEGGYGLLTMKEAVDAYRKLMGQDK